MENTGYCKPVKAWISVNACKNNKEKKWMLSCEGCPGMGDTVGKKPTMKTCSSCGEEKKIHSYGQCARCLYAKYGKTMQPPKEDTQQRDPMFVKPVVETKPETKKVVESIPQIISHHKSNLELLVPVAAPELKISRIIIEELREAEITDEDVEELLRMALAGELRRVA